MSLKRVLIVDDEENVTSIMSIGLSSNYMVEIANNGTEALAKCQQTSFDLVITDYHMPDMSGIELGKMIQRRWPQTQIVLMTAFNSNEVRQAAKTIQLDGYFEKPIPIAEIRGVVARALERARANSKQATKTLDEGHDLRRIIQKLQVDTRAICVLLLRTEGYLVVTEGTTQGLDITSIGALVAANFMAATELARLLGNQSIFKASYHEGVDYDIYAYGITSQFLLAVIFGLQSKTGLVRHYTQEAATHLQPLLDDMMNASLDIVDDMPDTLEADLNELFGL